MAGKTGRSSAAEWAPPPDAEKEVLRCKFATSSRPVLLLPAIQGCVGAAATIANMMIITIAITNSSSNTSASAAATTAIIITSTATGAAANPCDYLGNVNHGHNNQRAGTAGRSSTT